MSTKSHFSGGTFDGIELDLVDVTPPATIELGVAINTTDYVALNKTERYRFTKTEYIEPPMQQPHRCGQLETHWYFDFVEEDFQPQFGIYPEPNEI